MKKDSAVEFHSDIASQFDEKYHSSSQFLQRKNVWENLIRKYSNPKYRVLDLGCGSGVFVAFSAKHNREVVAVDGSSAMLAICGERLEVAGAKNVRLVEQDIKTFLTLELGQFDLVICSSILEYLENLDEVIGRLKKLLAPEGVLVFSIPNGDSLYRRVEPWIYKLFRRPRYYVHVKNIRSESQLVRQLRDNGLEVVGCSYLGETPLLSRVVKKFGGTRYSENMLLIEAKLQKN